MPRMSSKETMQVTINYQYKPISTGVLGKCLEFPFIIIKAKDVKTLEKEMIDAVIVFLQNFPEQQANVNITRNNNLPIPQIQAHRKGNWQERQHTKLITVRR